MEEYKNLLAFILFYKNKKTMFALCATNWHLKGYNSEYL